MDSLENCCARYVAQNLRFYKKLDSLQYLPSSIKTKIITNASQKYCGITDEAVLSDLLHRNLRKLSLSATSMELTDHTLEIIANKSPKLLRISMSNGNFAFTKDGLMDFFQKLSNLRILFISNCPIIDDDVIKVLTKSCRYLDLLDINGSKNVTDKSMLYIARSNITQLNLARTKITDRSLQILANSPLRHKLIDINLSNCAITDFGLKFLQNGKIKYIGLDGCPIKDGLECIERKLDLKYMSWTIPFNVI